MISHKWQMTAKILALFLRENWFNINRGTFRISCENQKSAAFALFGNDNYNGCPEVRRDLDQIRHRLYSAGFEELGFGVSPDGLTWAFLINPDNQRYQTSAAKAFQAEMLKIFLEDVAEETWHDSQWLLPPREDRANLEICQMTK